jgi:hypothetical protein
MNTSVSVACSSYKKTHRSSESYGSPFGLDGVPFGDVHLNHLPRANALKNTIKADSLTPEEIAQAREDYKQV